jgi:hypothetical protein
VSTAAILFSFPLPCFLPVLAPQVWRRIAMECIACVLAFVPHVCRAAADGGSWAGCASELRRRRAKSDAGSGG